MRLPPNGSAATLQGGVSAGEFRPSGEVSAQPATCADGSRWSDLLGMVVHPGIPARLLAPTPGGRPRPLGEGDADALLLEAERLGGLAVVASVRDDLVAVDLDGCAALVLPRLLDAAEQVGAALVYLAASGSDDSRHAVFGCPTTAGREWLRGTVEQVRVWAGLEARAVDLRSGPGGGFRMPGSVALKTGGGEVVPVDLDGRKLRPLEAARRAREALAEVGLPLVPAEPTEPVLGLVKPDNGPTRTKTPAPAGPAPLEAAGLVDRGWSARPKWTRDDWTRLYRPHIGGDRSAAATDAARLLARSRVKDWAEARHYYRKYPAFSKYRDRPDGGRVHWRGVVRWTLAYRGPVDEATASRCADWLAEAKRWTTPDEAAAVVAVVSYRFADGRGLEARPIAVRDLAVWLGYSRSKAHRMLAALQGRGVLLRVRSHADGPTNEAALYSLGAVPVLSGGHEVTARGAGGLDPAVVLSPVWAKVGQACRAVWSALGRSGVSDAAAAGAAGLPLGRWRQSGVRLLLERLEAAGLAERCADGWRRGRASLREAAVRVGAGAVVDRVRLRVVAERTLWHSRVDAVVERAERVLVGLRSVRSARGAVAGAVRVAGAAVGGSGRSGGVSVRGRGSAGVWGRSGPGAVRAGPVPAGGRSPGGGVPPDTEVRQG